MINDSYIQSLELQREKIDSFEKYPFNLDVIKHLEKINFHKNVTFILWENWTWKSTLIEALAIAYWFNPEWGSKNFNFVTQDTHSELFKKIRISKWFSKPDDAYFLRSESFYNLASNIDELEIYDAYWWKSLHK